MPEWIVERGIGETRYALVDGEEIVEAQVELEEIVPAGRVLEAKLTTLKPRTIAVDGTGNEYLLAKVPSNVTEGETLQIQVIRSGIPGAEPWKRALARPASDNPGKDIEKETKHGSLPDSWNDLIEQARSGIVRFEGGELRISPTPAMTLIDVDGYLGPAELAVRGAAEAAKAIRRLDIGGPIGIDLPTSGSKAARQDAAAAIDAVLPQPFERTAVNGFGFVQIVRPRRRASLIELAQERAPFEARALLRRAQSEQPGGKRLVAHPAVIAVLEAKPGWIEKLARKLGGEIELRPDASLPMSGGYATSL